MFRVTFSKLDVASKDSSDIRRGKFLEDYGSAVRLPKIAS